MSLQGQFFAACKLSKTLDIFILREGTKTHPSWRFLCCKTGKFLGQWSPVTKTCFRNGEHDQIEDWKTAVETIAGAGVL